MIVFFFLRKVYDLLDPKLADLSIREDQDKNIFVAGLSECQIKNVQQFNEAFGPASKNRYFEIFKCGIIWFWL